MNQETGTIKDKPSLKTRAKDLLKGWFGKSILLPFIITRLVWVAVGLFSKNLAANPTYEQYSTRGWFLSPHFLIDIWTRWDAKWYLSIIENGYVPSVDPSSTISNIAFMPVYPYLVKFFTLFVPAALRSRSLTLLTGVIVSNLCFLLAAVLLYRLVRDMFESEKLAERTLLLYFVFPTGYYFSVFYTEGIFFLLTLVCFSAALKKRWLPASLFAVLLTLTRVQGILIILPLAILYMQEINWKFKKIQADVLGLAISPILLLAYSFYMDKLSGTSLVLIKIQEAWGRVPGNLFERLWIEIGAPVLDIFKFDLFFLLFFILTALLLMRKSKTLAFGIFTFLMVFIPLASGSVIAGTRYVLPCFPVFIYWADIIKNERIFNTLNTFLFTFQVLFFLSWCNYYWIG